MEMMTTNTAQSRMKTLATMTKTLISTTRMQVGNISEPEKTVECSEVETTDFSGTTVEMTVGQTTDFGVKIE